MGGPRMPGGQPAAGLPHPEHRPVLLPPPMGGPIAPAPASYGRSGDSRQDMSLLPPGPPYRPPSEIPRVMAGWAQPRVPAQSPSQQGPPFAPPEIARPTSEEECEDETTTLPPVRPTKCTTVIGKTCFLDTSDEVVAGRQSPSRPLFPPKEGADGIPIARSVEKVFNVSNAKGRFSDRLQQNAAPNTKIFGGKSYFRRKSPVPGATLNKTFEERAYFRQKPLNDGASEGGSSSRFACAVYGSMVPILLVIVGFGWYKCKDYRRRRHYRLLGSFKDSRHPAYELDPDCNDCDYKSALQLQQQQTAVAS
ncbi:hypothetical protein MTO96_030447 [Rhipicephalus appendiculatus]